MQTDTLEQEFSFRFLNVFNLFFALKKMSFMKDVDVLNTRSLLEEMEEKFANTLRLMCYKMFEQTPSKYKDCSNLITQTLNYNQSVHSKEHKLQSLIKVVWKAFQLNFDSIDGVQKNLEVEKILCDKELFLNKASNTNTPAPRSPLPSQKLTTTKIILVGDSVIPVPMTHSKRTLQGGSPELKKQTQYSYQSGQGSQIPRREPLVENREINLQIISPEKPTREQGTTSPRLQASGQKEFESDLMMSCILSDPDCDNPFRVVSICDTPARMSQMPNGFDDDNVKNMGHFSSLLCPESHSTPTSASTRDPNLYSR